MSTDVSKVCGNADGFAQSVQQSAGWLHCAQDRGQWRQSAKLGEKSDRDVVTVKTQWGYTSHGGPSASGMLMEHSCLWRGLVLIGGGGVEWCRVVVVAPNDDDRERESE